MRVPQQRDPVHRLEPLELGGERGVVGLPVQRDTARDFRGTMAKLIDYLGKYRLTVMVVL